MSANTHTLPLVGTNFHAWQKGVGMLEVLIAILVIAIGALGFAGIQLKALSSSEEANYRAHATLIAQDAIERFLANPSEMDRYTTPALWSVSVDVGEQTRNWKQCINADCDSVQMASWEIEQLQWVAANSLPDGRIQARDCTFNGLDCVVVSWAGQEPENCMSPNGINVSEDAACLVMEVIR